MCAMRGNWKSINSLSRNCEEKMFADCHISPTGGEWRWRKIPCAVCLIREKCGNYISGFQAATDTSALGFSMCAIRSATVCSRICTYNIHLIIGVCPDLLAFHVHAARLLPREKSIFRVILSIHPMSLSSVTIT